MKAWHIAAIVGGVVSMLALVVGLIVFYVFVSTSGAADAANDFFSRISAGEQEAAYRNTAPEFQSETSLEEFRAFTERNRLERYRDASWNSREISGHRATLRGDLEMEGGGEIRATVVLLQLGETWRVYFVDIERAGASEEPTRFGAGRALPLGVNELRSLVLETLLSFNDAIQRADFTEFHARLATPFRERHDPAAIRNAFQQFIDRQIDISGIQQVQPVFDERTSVDESVESGRLNIKGRYPTRPSEVQFDLTYYWDEGAWRLVQINVRVVPADNQ